MLSALDSSFVSCCSKVQFYELLLVLSFRHVTVITDALSCFATHMNAMPEDHETAHFCQVQTLLQTDDKLRRLLHNAYDKHPVCKDILDKLRDG